MKLAKESKLEDFYIVNDNIIIKYKLGNTNIINIYDLLSGNQIKNRIIEINISYDIFFMFLKILCIVIILIMNISVAISQENKKKCRINTNKQILDFIKKELKPFNNGSNDEGPRLSQSDLKLLEIKHYSDQLKDSREMRMDILSFSTLNRQD